MTELQLPTRRFGYRKDTGGAGAVFSLRGEIRPPSISVEDDIAALADGVARTFDLELADVSYLESVQRYESGPTWTDNTTEAESVGGTPFTLLGASTDYHYFGHRERFNKMTVDLDTLGSYGALTWEYSSGTSAWSTLTVTDGTSGFTQDGSITFTPPSAWKPATVNSVEDKFWVRVSAASVTTAATANQISENQVYNCVMSKPSFSREAATPGRQPYDLIFMQQENP